MYGHEVAMRNVLAMGRCGGVGVEENYILLCDYTAGRTRGVVK